MPAPLKLLAPADAVETSADSKRAAHAYRKKLKDVHAGEAKRQAQEAELYRRELAAVLDALGDALIDGDRAKTIVWYGVASRLVAKPE